MATLAVVTSGGDSPGMNAAIRAFCRSALYEGHTVYAIRNGYDGLLNEELSQLSPRDLGMIINIGGTFLGTSRSTRFMTEESQRAAASVLAKFKVDCLCVIGGDGSFRGALSLSSFFKGQIIGIPGTIDNDIPGTDYTIGYDTAVATAVWAIDKIRDTAYSHGRIFIIEVMGRKSGQIAISVALGSGAEELIVPEHPYDLTSIAHRLLEGERRGKRFSIIVVAEGVTGGSETISKILLDEHKLETRVAILGHIQRGGTPTAYERSMATRMGMEAYKFFTQKLDQVFCSYSNGILQPVSLESAVNNVRIIDPEILGSLRQLGN